MTATAQNAIIINGATTYEEAVAALALHFGGAPVNLSTGEEVPVVRDATAVFTGTTLQKEQFTGTAALSVSTGATAATAQPTIELDINGLPWDERIHSSSKNKNADGSWRGRKGVPPPTITKVKAELLAKLGTSGAVASVTPATVSDKPVSDDAARQARIDAAKQHAFSVAGNPPCDNDTFEKLQKGQLVTVAPYVNAWFEAWQAEMNKAFAASAAPAAPVTQTAHVGLQTIAPDASTNQPVQLSAAAAPDVNTFAGFAGKYAVHVANPVFGEVLATLGVVGGFSALAANEPMIPAVIALLAAKGIA